MTVNNVQFKPNHLMRSDGRMYGFPPCLSHSRPNSCSRISAPRFLVRPVSSRLSSHICMSSLPINPTVFCLKLELQVTFLISYKVFPNPTIIVVKETLCLYCSSGLFSSTSESNVNLKLNLLLQTTLKQYF